MLVKFHSPAGHDVLMFYENARPILDMLHKDMARGVITAAEMGEALARLEHVIDDSRTHSGSSNVERDIGHEENPRHHAPYDGISFAARAFPLLELMRAARTAGQDVVWEV